MRAIILSAGQGRRLLPLTENRPKCLLTVYEDRTVLDLQLRALSQCGVEQATVMVGFGADLVEEHLTQHPVPGLEVETLFNPFYKLTDNLITVWLAQRAMDGNFLLLNGDTLFDAPVLERLLTAPPAPITIAINEKSSYDEDDMKVSLNGRRRLRAVGKSLDPQVVDGESIGLMRFQGDGVRCFRQALEVAVRDEASLKAWYLSVLNGLADHMPIYTSSITGLWWGEVDSAEDLESVRAFYDERKRPERVYAASAR